MHKDGMCNNNLQNFGKGQTIEIFSRQIFRTYMVIKLARGVTHPEFTPRPSANGLNRYICSN